MDVRPDVAAAPSRVGVNSLSLAQVDNFPQEVDNLLQETEEAVSDPIWLRKAERKMGSTGFEAVLKK